MSAKKPGARTISSLAQKTAEHFAATFNQLKGKVTMLFITHALPKNLLVDGVVRIGGGSVRGSQGLPANGGIK